MNKLAIEASGSLPSEFGYWLLSKISIVCQSELLKDDSFFSEITSADDECVQQEETLVLFG